MERQRVSVIMPAYNYERWVAGAIDSVLAQDYPADRLELIVVDDGSTDGTHEILASYGDAIRVIRQPNGGLNAATTTGIEAATGDLLCFIDADDLWHPNRTRLLVDALERHPEAGIAFGDMEVIDAEGTTTHASFRRFLFISAQTEGAFGRLLAANFISAGSMMVRASLRDRFHPIPDMAPYQDWWMATRVAEVAPIVAIDDVVNRYRHHDDNMNLGAEGERVLNMRLKELPYRRWMLVTASAHDRTPEEQVAALNAYDMILGEVANAKGLPAPHDAHPSTEEDRAGARALREQAEAALAHGDDAAAVEALVRACALEPSSERETLAAAIARLRGEDEGAPRCRTFAAFVKMEDVRRYPHIVARWSERFDGSSDATLVIGGVTETAHVNNLVDLVTRLGIHGEHGADLVTIAEDTPVRAEARLGRRFDLVLTPAAA